MKQPDNRMHIYIHMCIIHRTTEYSSSSSSSIYKQHQQQRQCKRVFYCCLFFFQDEGISAAAAVYSSIAVYTTLYVRWDEENKVQFIYPYYYYFNEMPWHCCMSYHMYVHAFVCSCSSTYDVHIYIYRAQSQVQVYVYCCSTPCVHLWCVPVATCWFLLPVT